MPPVTSSDSQEQSQPSPSSSSPNVPSLKERRFKLSRACDRCRRRRIKCDEGHPCQACLTANSACTFEEPGKRAHPHKSKHRRTTTLEDRMHHLESLISAIPPAVFAAGGQLPALQPGNQAEATSPLMPFSYPTGLQSGVPPPSLHVFPLTNPSNHFTQNAGSELSHRRQDSANTLLAGSYSFTTPGQFAEETSKMSLTASYLYFDDEGNTRWQGETSGLPVLDLLVERHGSRGKQETKAHPNPPATADWFPDRQLRKTDVNPQMLWRLITSSIAPDLMDSLVQCFLSTSYYILPFLHVPTFLADYGNPQKWAEPGFAAFILSICCLASRHMDDPRVRSNPNDGITAGTQWFDLLGRLRTIPIADRPTLYNIQADLVAAVYAVGLGKLSKAASLLAEAVTLCIDAGLHRSADNYDLFDPIDDEIRKRTFWCVYIWDKQLAAHFGRPTLLRLRDCDIAEPTPVDDEFITREGVGIPPPGSSCRMGAFITTLQIMVVLEAVLDVPPARQSDNSNSFLLRATNLLHGVRKFKPMHEEEALLDDIHRNIPPYWAHTPETLASDDTIRVTQAVRLHCAEQYVRLFIYRHRFSELVAERTSGPVEEEQTEQEKEALAAAQNAALLIIGSHLHVAKKGLMTYYGVHVIHQLTQAGRTLVAVLLCCQSEALQHLIQPGLDALRSCIGLLRRFSGRYVCGLRSGDLMEEFCRLTNIPLETSRQDSSGGTTSARPPWIRPVRKKASSVARSNHSDSASHSSSPEAFSPVDFFSDSKAGNGTAFVPGPPLSSSSSSHNGSAPGFNMDAGSGIGIDLRGEDAQMYMSPGEMMAFFSDGNMDITQLFSAETFLQGHSPAQSHLQHPPQSVATLSSQPTPLLQPQQ